MNTENIKSYLEILEILKSYIPFRNIRNKFSNRNNIIILLSNFKIDGNINQNIKNQFEVREKIKDNISGKEILGKKVRVINYEFDKLGDFLNIENIAKEKQADFFITGNIINELDRQKILLKVGSSFETESKKDDLESKFKKINIKYEVDLKSTNKEDLKLFWEDINILFEFSLNPYKRTNIIDKIDKEDIIDNNYKWIINFQSALKSIKKYKESKKDSLNQQQEENYKKQISATFEIALEEAIKDRYKIIIMKEYIDFLSDFDDKKTYKYVIELYNQCFKKSIEDKYIFDVNKVLYRSNFYIRNENKAGLISLKSEINNFISKYSNVDINITLLNLLSNIIELEYVQQKITYDDLVSQLSLNYKKTIEYFSEYKEKFFFEKLSFLKNIKFKYLSYEMILNIISIFPISNYIIFLKLNLTEKGLLGFYYSIIFGQEFENFPLIQLFLTFNKNNRLEDINLIYNKELKKIENKSIKDIKNDLIKNIENKDKLMREVGVFHFRLGKEIPSKCSSYEVYENKMDSLFLYLNRDLKNQEVVNTIFTKSSKSKKDNYSDNFNLGCFLFENGKINEAIKYIDKAINGIYSIIYPFLQLYSVGIIYIEYLNKKEKNKKVYNNLFLIIYILKDYPQLWTEEFNSNIYSVFIENSDNNYLIDESIKIKKDILSSPLRKLVTIDNIHSINLNNPFKIDYNSKFSIKFTIIFLSISGVIFMFLVYYILKFQFNFNFNL